MVTVDEIRELARTLPRSAEVFVRGRITFRVGRIVWLVVSRDGSELRFAFPNESRQALVESKPDKFRLADESDLEDKWVETRLEALDRKELRELVLEAWSLVASSGALRHMPSG